jgi:hypothetical protein
VQPGFMSRIGSSRQAPPGWVCMSGDGLVGPEYRSLVVSALLAGVFAVDHTDRGKGRTRLYEAQPSKRVLANNTANIV